MSKNVHKSAAVPFVNDKGERSMKRVKVERYVAGKKPAYAKDDDEESIYSSGGEEVEDEDQTEDDDDVKNEDDVEVSGVCRSIEYATDDIKGGNRDSDDDDDDDDPRLRRLKQINSKHIIPKFESKSSRTVVIDEDEDDDEEEVRRRHALARRRRIEEPLGSQAIFGESTDRQNQRQVSKELGNLDEDESEEEDDLVSKKDNQIKRLDTDDLLKDFKPTGLGLALESSGPIKTDEEREAERKKIREALEQSKQEAKLTLQLHKRIEEDSRRELEKEALAKGDIGAREMSSVSTDDEDDELAYEEWKLREIKRVLRDRSERVLEFRDRSATKVH